MNETKTCEKCKKELNLKNNFYYSHNAKKYPDGYLNICKNCLSADIDYSDSETYLWILQECDVPYIIDEWNKLLNRYSKGLSTYPDIVIDRYLRKIKLRDFKNYKWKDTSFLNEINNKGGKIIG